MSLEQRFLTGFREVSEGEPGIVQEDDGTCWLVNPDGSRTQLPGGGGSGGTVIQQNTDPGAVGAGTLWVNTTANPDAGIPAIVKPTLVRNAADDGWIEQGLIHYNGDGGLSSFVTLDDGSAVVEGHDADGISNGALAIYGGVGGGVFLRGRETYLQQKAGDAVYFYLADQQFWFNNESAGHVWGISAPSGSEKFVSIDPPDSSEIDANQRLHWFDAATMALRFLQKDSFGTVSQGRSAGIDDAYGTLDLHQIGIARCFFSLIHPMIDEDEQFMVFPYNPVGGSPSAVSETKTYPPVTVGAAATVATVGIAAIQNIDTTHRQYDLTYDVRVTSLDGTQQLFLSASITINNGIPNDSGAVFPADMTVGGSVGTDLAYDPGTGIISSVAGGSFVVWVSPEGGYD